MEPYSPILEGCREIVIAKNQPPYKPLAAVEVDNNTILTRWKLTWRERLIVLLCGDVYLYIMTFGQPLQPLKMQVERPSATPSGEEGAKKWPKP